MDHHRAAIALQIAHYNFCRVHESLRVTPAMEFGLTTHIWSVEELICAAEATPVDLAPLPTHRPSRGQAGSLSSRMSCMEGRCVSGCAGFGLI